MTGPRVQPPDVIAKRPIVRRRGKPGLRIDKPGKGTPPSGTAESGKPSVAVVKPSAPASPLTHLHPINNRGQLSPLGDPGSGKTEPSQTGKPWPGGGTVPAPDTGSHDAIRTDMRKGSVPAGAKPYSVTPASKTPHIHV